MSEGHAEYDVIDDSDEEKSPFPAERRYAPPRSHPAASFSLIVRVQPSTRCVYCHLVNLIEPSSLPRLLPSQNDGAAPSAPTCGRHLTLSHRNTLFGVPLPTYRQQEAMRAQAQSRPAEPRYEQLVGTHAHPQEPKRRCGTSESKNNLLPVISHSLIGTLCLGFLSQPTVSCKPCKLKPNRPLPSLGTAPPSLQASRLQTFMLTNSGSNDSVSLPPDHGVGKITGTTPRRIYDLRSRARGRICNPACRYCAEKR
jgi:hypothetical protein